VRACVCVRVCLNGVIKTIPASEKQLIVAKLLFIYFIGFGDHNSVYVACHCSPCNLLSFWCLPA